MAMRLVYRLLHLQYEQNSDYQIIDELLKDFTLPSRGIYLRGNMEEL